MAPDPALTPDPADLSAAVEHALAALDDRAARGGGVDDEWQDVQDLAASWRDRLQSVAAGRETEPLAPPAGSAIMRLASEARQVDDPHRAIDWLSTFPQAVLVALGERP